MYKTIRRSFLTASFALILALGFQNQANAQLGDAGDFLRAGTADANLLMESYLKPFGTGFGAGLNSGWTNTARPYRTLGFDLRLNVALAVVPGSDRSFLMSDLEPFFSSLERIGGPDETQTPFGEDITGPTMGIFVDNPYSGNREMVGQFDMPKGTGIPYVPSAMVQLTVGVIKDTDISLRYMPTVTYDDYSASLFGLGFKHGINQWLPGGNLLPVDISVQMGYTKLTSEAGFSVLPPANDGNTTNPYSADTWLGQQLEFEANGFTGSVLVGKNLPFVAIYGGVGYQTSKVTISTPGNYPIIVPNTAADFLITGNEKRVDIVADPINLKFESENSMHLLAGARIRLGFFAISASYTLAKYPVANVGVGISIR
jgi:hypothetical protein